MTADNIVQIERTIGQSLPMAFKNLESNLLIEIINATLWSAMQSIYMDFTLGDAETLANQYIDDGHDYMELMREIAALLETAGYSIRNWE